MMIRLKNLGILAMIGLLSACGSTSGLRQVSEQNKEIDFTQYQHVVVGSFTSEAAIERKFGSKAPKSERKKAKLAEKKRIYRENVRLAAIQFARNIVTELRKVGQFETVVKSESAGAGSLRVSGKVTRYSRGNAAGRVLIGLGAGSAYFDAMVEIRDGDTNELLSVVKVDKNSWPLGGWLAGIQNTDRFIYGAAKKIAKEMSKAADSEASN